MEKSEYVRKTKANLDTNRKENKECEQMENSDGEEEQ